MLAEILGSKTASLILLDIYHQGEVYATGMSKDMVMSVGQIQRQFDRLENAGLIVSKLAGRTRIYTFNEKSAVAKKLKELVGIIYDSLPLEEKEKLFGVRRRPRRKGKPIVRKRAAA